MRESPSECVCVCVCINIYIYIYIYIYIEREREREREREQIEDIHYCLSSTYFHPTPLLTISYPFSSLFRGTVFALPLSQIT